MKSGIFFCKLVVECYMVGLLFKALLLI